MTKPTNHIDVLEGIFPWNLALDVLLPFGADTAERWRTLSEVYAPGVMEALESLSDRERKVIVRRYRDGDTLEQIGKDFGVVRERIRQIEAKARRKLRHPARQGLFMAVTRAQYQELKQDYWELLDRYKQLRDMLPAEEQASTGMQDNSDPMAMPIADLDLSVRSYNCLLRAGVKTVGDIAKMSERQMLRIRNFGKKSEDEVLGRLRALGVELNHEEEKND